MNRLIPVEYFSPLIAKDFEGQELKVMKGWSTSVAKQLVERSLEPAILEATPLDASRRFPDEERATEWHDDKENARITYFLFRAAEVAGFIWFSQQYFGGAHKTFGMRMYESARGMKLGKPFGQVAHFDHEHAEGYHGDTWLETGRENEPALALFPQLKYKYVEAVGIQAGRVRMVRSAIDSPIKRTPTVIL